MRVALVPMVNYPSQSHILVGCLPIYAAGPATVSRDQLQKTLDTLV